VCMSNLQRLKAAAQSLLPSHKPRAGASQSEAGSASEIAAQVSGCSFDLMNRVINSCMSSF